MNPGWIIKGSIVILIIALPTVVFSQDGVSPAVFNIKVSVKEFNPSSITVKKGEKVIINFTSDDVTHGITLSEFGLEKRLIYKDKQTIIEFVPQRMGRFRFPCTKYCSWRHLLGLRPHLRINVK